MEKIYFRKPVVVSTAALSGSLLLFIYLINGEKITELIKKIKGDSEASVNTFQFSIPLEEIAGAETNNTFSRKHLEISELSEQNFPINTPSNLQSNADLWFASKEELAKLAAREIPIQRKGNCSEELEAAADFQSFSRDTFDFPLDKRQQQPGTESEDSAYALASHVLQTSLFFKQNEKFVQINAKWNGNQPPTYRIAAYSFSNNILNGKPENAEFSEFDSSENYDIESVRTILRQIQSRTQTEGNIAQKISRFDGKTNRVAYFFDAVPLTYEGNGEGCSVQLKTLTALCFCQFTERTKERTH